MGTTLRWNSAWRPTGLAAALLAIGPLLRADTNQVNLTLSDVASAVKIDGLTFSDEEETQMLKGLQSRLKDLDELRQRSFPNWLPPALVFDPLPPGFKLPSERRPFKWHPPKNVSLPAHRDDLAFYSVGELAALLRAKKITSEELTRFSLDRLKKYGPQLHCVVTLLEDRAIASARRADAEIAAGKWRGPLHGIPYGAKDLLAVHGAPTTWGAPPYTNQVIDTDATVIRKLDEAGAVLTAKLSLGELAMGDVWFGGLTRNPWQPDKGSSGSSAGSASAVAAGLLPFAIGSETLGSIVSPSTVCGVTGLRPTFGRVSRTGAMTLCWSLDKLGPLARSAQDCALVLEAIRGPDGSDLAAIDAPFNYGPPRPMSKIRIGFLKETIEKSKGNRTNDLASIDVLRRLGADLKPVTLPKYPNGAFYLILDAEASAAFDELTRSHADRTLVQQADWNWPNAFRKSRTISAVDYIQANRVRTQLIADMDALFKDIDVLVSPSFAGDMLVFSNFSGHPTVVVPNGDKTGGAEASICFVGKLFGEADAVAVAESYQNATAWHKQRPDLSKLGNVK